MTPQAILAWCAEQGIVLSAEEGKLRYRAVAGAMTPGLAARLKVHKAELLEALRLPARQDLEHLHPAIIEGIPLAAILDCAEPADGFDLQDLGTLQAFARSLISAGLLTPRAAAGAALPEQPEVAPLVCCSDCAHFEPDRIGDGSGIGTCAAGVAVRPEVMPFYPHAARCCRRHRLIRRQG